MLQPTYVTKPKSCTFCEENSKYIDYKDIKTLRKYLSPYSRILSRERTGTCAKHQRSMAAALKRARFMALLPYVTK
jgi:small subunit ribosomal protein S18